MAERLWGFKSPSAHHLTNAAGTPAAFVVFALVTRTRGQRSPAGPQEADRSRVVADAALLLVLGEVSERTFTARRAILRSFRLRGPIPAALASGRRSPEAAA